MPHNLNVDQLIENIAIAMVENIPITWADLEKLLKLWGAEADLIIPIAHVIFYEATKGKDSIESGVIINEMYNHFH